MTLHILAELLLCAGLLGLVLYGLVRVENMLEEKKMGEKTKLADMNIHGHSVSIHRWEGSNGNPIYNAYVTIQNSRYIKLPEGICTYRNEDEVGVDTGKTYQKDYSETKKLLIAIEEITKLIEICQDTLIQD